MVLYNGMAATSPLAALYFVALMTFGNYVLFNLLVAILVEGFQAEVNKLVTAFYSLCDLKNPRFYTSFHIHLTAFTSTIGTVCGSSYHLYELQPSTVSVVLAPKNKST